MKNKITSLAIVLTLSASLFGLAYGDPINSRFSPEQKKYVESLRPLINSGIKNVLEPQAKISQEAQEELQVTRMVLDEKSNANECVDQVVKILRQQYVNSKAGIAPVFIGSSSKIGSDNLPLLLYLFKRSTVGLYEYTKLSGMSSQAIDALWSDGKKWEDDDMLAYRLFALVQEPYYQEMYHYSSGISIINDQALESLKKLSEDYRGTKSEGIVRGFIMRFAFDQNSYVTALTESKDLPNEADRYEALLAYFSSLIKSPDDKAQFLSRSYEIFGGDALRALFKSLLQDKTFPKYNPSAIQRYFKLAINARLYDVALDISKFMPDESCRSIILERENAIHVELADISQIIPPRTMK